MSASSFNPPSYKQLYPRSKESHCESAESELHKHCEEVRKKLRQYGFKKSHESRICVALDVSYSMENPNQFYNTQNLADGKVQRLLIKALSLASELSAG